jgi:hypothetical protein
MKISEQRNLGISLAKEANAAKTLQILENTTSCYKDILNTAMDELGLEKLCTYLVKGDPIWSYQALRNINDLGTHRDVLIKKAMETPDAAVHTLRFIKELGSNEAPLREAAGNLASPLVIFEFELHAEDTLYTAYYIMHWTNNGTAYSNEIYVSEWKKNICDQFTGGKPMAPGDIMSISVHAAGGQTVDSPLQFSWVGPFGPNKNNWTVAKFVASGTVDSVHLDYGGSWNPGDGH